MGIEEYANLDEWRPRARRHAWHRLVWQGGLSVLAGLGVALGGGWLTSLYLVHQTSLANNRSAAGLALSGSNMLHSRTGASLPLLQREQAQFSGAVTALQQAQCEQQRWLLLLGQLEQRISQVAAEQPLELQRVSVRHQQVILELTGPLEAVNELLRQWQLKDAESRIALIEHRPMQGRVLSRVRLPLQDECWGAGKGELPATTLPLRGQHGGGA